MNQTLKPSALFQDLLALEKQYNLNLTLLQQKDEELVRCNNSKNILETTINSNLEEIKDLKRSVRDLEGDLRSALQSREKEKRICEDIVHGLTIKLNETKRRCRSELEESEDQLKGRLDDLQVLHEKNLNDIDRKWRNDFVELEEKLRMEISMGGKLKKQLESLLDDNMSLRNKIRELESKFQPEITIYRNELKTERSTNANLKTEIEILRKENDSFHVNSARIKSENERLLSELNQKQNQIVLYHQENTKLRANLADLNGKLQQSESKIHNLFTEIEGCRRRNKQLQDEIRCGSPRSFHRILKQNALLQQIVKSMRSERQNLINEEQVDAQETERRVERLEILIDELKRALTNNAFEPE